MSFDNVLVIIMCVLVVGVGLYTFLSEYVFHKDDDDDQQE